MTPPFPATLQTWRDRGRMLTVRGMEDPRRVVTELESFLGKRSSG